MKEEDDDDIKGPKIRHPSGPTYLDIIFLKDESDETKRLSSAARLYQDIIKYSFLTKKRPGFKITDIGHWLLKSNQDYVNHYKRSNDNKKTNATKLNGINKRIKRYLENLEQWGLIHKLYRVDSDTRNGLKTWLYNYTHFGYIMAWALVYHYNSEKRNTAKYEIYKLIQDMLTLFKSYMTDFLAKIYEKFMEYDENHQVSFFDRIIINLINVLESGNFHYTNAIEYLSHALDLVLRSGNTRVKAQELFRKALDELPEDVRRIVIRHEKSIIENNFVSCQPPKDWEKVWQDNINNYDKLVLYGICQNKECSSRSPVIANYYEYRYYQSISPHHYLLADCRACRTKGSLNVYDSLENLKL